MAQRGTQGVFAETYTVTTASAHGGTMRLQVSAAQRSRFLIQYRVVSSRRVGAELVSRRTPKFGAQPRAVPGSRALQCPY